MAMSSETGRSVAFLVQGRRKRLLETRLPEGAPVYRLCFDDAEPIPGDGFIHDPHCTWAEGRNRLIDLARRDEGHDYFVFCDDDCRFIRGGFAEFARQLLAFQPAVAIPVMPKARLYEIVLDQARQAAVVIDEQMVALHRSALDRPGLCPLAPDFDQVSWYAACLIFEHQALAAFGRGVVQFNDVEIANEGHSFGEPGSKYRIGTWDEYWPQVHDWLAANGGYVRAAHEPFYAHFFTDPRREAALSRLKRLKVRAAAFPVDRLGHSMG